jgi:hypothetical protein
VDGAVHWTAGLSPRLHDLYWGVNWWMHRLVSTIRP